MKKNTQPDVLVSRGALIAGCSMWKPIPSLVCHADGVGCLGDESDGKYGECPEVRVDEPAEDPAVPCDSGV